MNFSILGKATISSTCLADLFFLSFPKLPH